ncbi:5-oxoprolinase subunit PxpA [Melghirimyces algeriensis]|uniref:5-oxoprolinase subunit A n=1 Tax=Melghirimyces algeriensis TaxID=910412 RepID=A0A521BFG6_9BACL|nr:5-oxoprolinase subunit PxpA [Melghirimyces algeriensis]SMO45845.1 UPF0271 protein [Melghirimyces algeriensis]
MFRIDLNCDLGESFGAYKMGRDAEIVPYVTSVNIACGFHAGDPGVMHNTVNLALERGIAIGAHPGLPDLYGFGRRIMDISPQEAYDWVIYQIGALDAFIRAKGGTMRHVKPHGALYNMASRNSKLADAIAEAVYHVNPELILVGLSGSELIHSGKRIGLKTASEVFADRTYQEDGSLTPRGAKGALIDDPEQAVKQVVRMVKDGKVRSQQGSDIPIVAETVCIHGDGSHAVSFASRIHEALSLEGIALTASIR